MDRKQWPPADVARALMQNRFFLGRVTGVDLEEDDFDAFDNLLAGAQRMSVPIVLPGGFAWEVEYYDNGDDASVTHYLWSGETATEFAVADAHARGNALAWPDAQEIAGGDASVLLLLWSIIHVTESDDQAEVARVMASAWRAAGIDDAPRMRKRHVYTDVKRTPELERLLAALKAAAPLA